MVLSTRSASESWHLLRQGGHESGSGGIPSLLSGVEADAGPVRLALGPRGEGRLLLPVGESERVPCIPQTPTLRIRDEFFLFESRSWRFIDLTCLVTELDGVFGEVADEIMRRIADGHGALKACLTTLGEFRMLLVPKSSGPVKHEIVGLVGELLLLDALSEVDSDACIIWRGPMGERHDFRAGTLAVEVKTSSRAANEVLRVTSIDQLLEPEGGELVLFRYTLEESTGGRVSVGSLFASLATKVSDPLQLRDLLARAGCSDPGSDDWNGITFSLEETRAYRVTNAFPRLVPPSLIDGSLATGVSCVEYDVDLSSARETLLDEQQRREFLERMSACLRAA